MSDREFDLERECFRLQDENGNLKKIASEAKADLAAAKLLNKQRAEELNAAANTIIRLVKSQGNWRDIARDLAELAGMNMLTADAELAGANARERMRLRCMQECYMEAASYAQLFWPSEEAACNKCADRIRALKPIATPTKEGDQ